MTTARPAPSGSSVISRTASGIVSLALAVLVLITPARLRAQHASACGDDDKRQLLRSRIEALMLSDNAESAAELRMFHIARIHPDSVVYIDDERLCERAAKVYYRYRLGPRPLGAVSV